MYNFHEVLRENKAVHNHKYPNIPSHLYSILNNDGWRIGKWNALLKQSFNAKNLYETKYQFTQLIKNKEAAETKMLMTKLHFFSTKMMPINDVCKNDVYKNLKSTALTKTKYFSYLLIRWLLKMGF